MYSIFTGAAGAAGAAAARWPAGAAGGCWAPVALNVSAVTNTIAKLDFRIGLVIILSSWVSMDGVRNCCFPNNTYFDPKYHAGIHRRCPAKKSLNDRSSG
jgi:hypothetical protein